MEKTLESAIINKQLVEFRYGGHYRVAEPHVLGVNGGVLQFLGYQVGGSSSSGGIPEWRRFDLGKMFDLKILDQSFPGRRPFPSGKHSHWERQFAVVS